VSKAARQRRPGACCHLHTQFCESAEVPAKEGVFKIELVPKDGVWRGLSISLCMADAKKSSLLGIIPIGEPTLWKEDSGSIQELLLLSPSIEFSNWLLKKVALADIPFMAIGEVGWPESRPKCVKLLASPLPWAMEEFHMSKLYCDAEG
jgi:hypothetical protein